jgi:hypothetical protein
VRRGAGWTGGVSPAAVWSRRWPGTLAVSSVELSGLLIDKTASAPADFPTTPSGRHRGPGREYQVSGMASVAGRCPSFGVHHPALSGSGCPAVRLSSRPVSGHRGSSSGSLSGRRASAVRCPTGGVRPSPDHVRLLRISRTVALGITSVPRGNLHDWTDRDSCRLPRPERLPRRPEEAWDAGDAAEAAGSVGRGERGSRIWLGRAPAQTAAALDR